MILPEFLHPDGAKIKRNFYHTYSKILITFLNLCITSVAGLIRISSVSSETSARCNSFLNSTHGILFKNQSNLMKNNVILVGLRLLILLAQVSCIQGDLQTPFVLSQILFVGQSSKHAF